MAFNPARVASWFRRRKLPAAYRDDLAGQVALVTGGNSGIGRAIALALAQAGADVAVNYLEDEAAADDVVKRIEESGRRGFAIRADIGDEQAVREMFASVIGRFGTLHILAANAGVENGAPVDQMTIEQWNDVIRINLTGQFLCVRQAVAEFKRRAVDRSVSMAAGKIVFISSIHQQTPRADHANYAASKGGLMQFMKSIALELAVHGVRVNAVAPGAVLTAINSAALVSPESRAKLTQAIPYRRMGSPEDIARAVVWLASDAADYVVGTTLVVDGGLSLYAGG